MDSGIFSLLGILVVVFLACSTLFLALAYHYLRKQFLALQSQQEYLYAKAHHKASKLVEEARDRSLEMINESEHKAEEILMKTDFLSAISEKEMSDEMKSVTHKETEEYKKVLEGVRQDIVTAFADISDSMRNQANKELEQFRQNVEKETVKTEQSLTSQLDQEYTHANQEVEAYKKELMTKLDASISTIISKVTQQVWNKSLSAADQESLVIKALEEAKHQHVF